MRVVLVGKNGQIGGDLERHTPSTFELISLGRQELNLENSDAIRKMVRTMRPDLLINAAAYTAVDRAECEEAKAYQINAVAPGVMAEEMQAVGGILLHYSTDYVFDGTLQEPYGEDAQTAPINVYGRTKLVGEQLIEANIEKYLILRTSWVYGLRGSNFLLTMLRLSNERSSLSVVNDQIGVPNWSDALACWTWQIAQQLSCSTRWGVYHLTASESASWYQFAREIFALSHISVGLEPITTAQYPTAAKRPQYSRLANSKVQEYFTLDLEDWQIYLRRCLYR